MTHCNSNLPDGVTDADIDYHFGEYEDNDSERERLAEQRGDDDRDRAAMEDK